MRTFLFTAVISSLFFQTSPTVQQVSSPTVQQVLGRDKVHSILNKVVQQSIKEASESFLVTEETLARLITDDVPQLIVTQLENLKGQEIKEREVFVKEVIKRLGKNQAERFRDAIFRNTQGYLVVADDFLAEVEVLVLKVIPPKRNAEDWLEKGFSEFLSGYIASTKDLEKKNKITLEVQEKLGEYINKRRAKCGERPCRNSVPACCADCDPCRP